MTKHAVELKSESMWAEEISEVARSRPALRADIATDVCVVGAGIAGLSVAYRLAREGLRVVVLDDGTIGGGQTEVTTAHLAYVLDRRYSELERTRGTSAARMAAASHLAAIEWIESIAVDEQIDCDFTRVDGYLFSPPDESLETLDREFETARRIGIIDVTRLARVPWRQFDAGPCLHFPRNAQFHPLKYLVGLAKAIERRGGKIHCNTHVKKIEGGDKAHIETDDGFTVSARDIVVATNVPVNDMFVIHTKQAPYITYAIGAVIPKGAVPRALYWDTADPFHYVRLQAGEDPGTEVLIIGGEDHKSGQAHDGEQRFARLEDLARERFLDIEEIAFRWAGQVMETDDGLAFIGRNPGDYENVFIATGDSGMGMTHGTIAGMLLTDLILERENTWTDLYDPSRKPMKPGSLKEFVKENVNVALQYGAYVTPGEVSSVDEIEAGHGAILRRGIHKVAVYRDKNGSVTELSAVCPHLKCLVSWNDTESTWDCPCHGSRFDAHGKMLNGPANIDLPRFEE